MASVATSILLQKGLPAVTNAAHNTYAPAGKWILGTAASVVGMIHVGGVTRLTQSGLSMTDWSPLGSLPPLTEEAWQAEFERYKEFPEWQQRKNMTLSEFQYIYGWEYGHRMLGRTVGLIFVLPWAYLSLRGRIPAGYQKRMVGLLAMGGTQGLVGWWMVKSGLGDDRRGDKHEIRVRPIRLATHLSMAVATYGALLWTGLDILGLPHKQTVMDQASKLSKEALKQAARLRVGSLGLTALTGITIVSGALVAGNDAGRAYNTFPKMDGEWIPSEIGELTPWYKNLSENTATVQFNHRVLGISTAASALGLVALGLSPARAALITPQARMGLYAVGAAALGQVTLGITTLLYYVPISLAAAHQVGSVVVFSSGVYLAHSLRYARPGLARLSGSGTTAAAGGGPQRVVSAMSRHPVSNNTQIRLFHSSLCRQKQHIRSMSSLAAQSVVGSASNRGKVPLENVPLPNFIHSIPSNDHFKHPLPPSSRMFSMSVNKDQKEAEEEDSKMSAKEAAESTTTTTTVQTEKPSFRAMVRQYGPLFIATYLSVYVSTVFGFYAGITSGALDPAYLLSFITSPPADGETAATTAEIVTKVLDRYSWTQWAVPYVEKNPWAANLSVAWVVTKPTEPIRFGVTVGLVPLLARTLGYTTPKPTILETTTTEKEQK